MKVSIIGPSHLPLRGRREGTNRLELGFAQKLSTHCSQEVKTGVTERIQGANLTTGFNHL